MSRHGYQFVCSEVVEEPDDDRTVAAALAVINADAADSVSDQDRDSLERLVDRLFVALDAGPDGLDDARETAERLHGLDTAGTISLVKRRPHHATALAVMRDVRWSMPEAGGVPLDAASSLALVRLRLAEARRTIARRWTAAALAGASGGIAAGLLGSLALSVADGVHGMAQSAVGLAAIGAVAGGIGAGGIGAGLAAAEVLARSRRGISLAACGAIAGGLVALAAHAVVRAILAGLVGARDIDVPGFFDGLVIGGAVGIGYAIATPQPPGGGIAAPRGGRRIAVAAITGIATAVAERLSQSAATRWLAGW